MARRIMVLALVYVAGIATAAGWFIFAPEPAKYEASPISGIWLSPDGRASIVEVIAGYCNRDGRISAGEETDVVGDDEKVMKAFAFDFSLREPEGICSAMQVHYTFTINLPASVSGKLLIDKNAGEIRRFTNKPKENPFKVEVTFW